MQAPKSKLIADSQMIAQYQERFPSPACKLPHPNQSIPFPRMISTRLPEAMEEDSVQESTSLFCIYDILASAKPEMLKRVSRDEYTARMLFSKRGGAKFSRFRERTELRCVLELFCCPMTEIMD